MSSPNIPGQSVKTGRISVVTNDDLLGEFRDQVGEKRSRVFRRVRGDLRVEVFA